MRPRITLCAAAAAVLLVAAPSVRSAGIVESMLAEEVAATLGNGVPAGARVALTLTSPFSGAIDAIRNLTYDPRTGVVRALVESGGRLQDITARAEVSVEVPVPARRLQTGEVITEADLSSVSMPLDRVADGIVTARETLVGMAARRQLAPGRLIQTTAIGAPVVVQRNKPVKLVYEDGLLMLAARGRALQDGGVGDVVRVMNAASSVIVTGTITGPQTVSVAGPQAVSDKP